MAFAATYPHLTFEPSGTIRIGQTRYKVSHLASEHYHYGWTAEELLRQHPDLRPEEVYAALTYFYDHYDQIVAELRSQEQSATDRPAQPVSREELLKRQAGVR
jgi:uncharacterized protein (DUF433 family)